MKTASAGVERHGRSAAELPVLDPLDLQAGTVKLEHQENYTETRDSTKQWEV